MATIAPKTEADAMRLPCDVTDLQSRPRLCEPYVSVERGVNYRRLMDAQSNGTRDADKDNG